MVKVSPTHSLGQAGREYLIGLYKSTVNKPLNFNHVDITVNPQLSQLKITSKAYTDTNEVGMYRGSHTVTYTKADIAKVMPLPVLYRGPWPTTYKVFCDWMYSNYGMVLEDGDFTMPGSTVALTEQSVMAGYPDGNDLFRMTAANSSIRWKAGTWWNLRVVSVENRTSVAGMVGQTAPGSMGSLVKK